MRENRLLLSVLSLAVLSCSPTSDSSQATQETSTTNSRSKLVSERTIPTAGDSESLSAVDVDEAAIRSVWKRFKEASLGGRGEVAASLITQETHDYYGEIRAQILTATKDELRRHTLARQLTVLGMRLRMDRDTLGPMSGRDLFSYAVDKGWIGKNSAVDEDIGQIIVTGSFARAVATKSGQPTPMYYNFVKRDGEWRLDMVPMMKALNAAIIQMQQRSGLSEDQWLSRIVESITGKKVTSEAWEPLDLAPTNVRPQH